VKIMPTACIHVFSGTGNSLNAANIIREKLEHTGYSVDLIPIRKETISPSGPFDLNVLVFPVYDMEIPHIVLKYLSTIPPGNNSRAAVIATIGKLYSTKAVFYDDGYEGGALEHARAVFEKKGYHVTHTAAVSYPANITLGHRFAVAQPAEVPGILALADERVKRIADSIVLEKPEIKKYPPLVPQVFTLLAPIFQSAGRRSIAKMFVASGKCTSCGYCVKVCPAAAIRLVRGRPRWNYQCEGCHRCINTCPQGAIEGSALRALTMIVLLFVPYAVLFSPVLAYSGIVLPSDGIAAFLAGLACWITGYSLFFVVLDIVYAQMERPPVDCPVALFGYTRGAYRYVNPVVDMSGQNEK
jgi:Pyruvate/2-oxoacid:ferredoxin oxidoreductase delta subunit/flavodoxin